MNSDSIRKAKIKEVIGKENLSPTKSLYPVFNFMSYTFHV